HPPGGAAARRPPDRSRHVGARPLRQEPARAGDVEGAVQAAPARARLPGGRVRPSLAAAGRVARPPRVGHPRVDSEGDAPARPGRQGRDLPVPRRRAAEGGVAGRSEPRDGPAQSDPDPGAASRAHARRRAPLRVRAGRAPDDCVPPPGAARASPRVRASDDGAAGDVRGAAARRHGAAGRAAAPAQAASVAAVPRAYVAAGAITNDRSSAIVTRYSSSKPSSFVGGSSRFATVKMATFGTLSLPVRTALRATAARVLTSK